MKSSFLKSLLIKIIEIRLNYLDNKNRKRLKNLSPTLICPSCIGGYIYHWLNLEFRSPFINLFMENDDFLIAMENFDNFINGPIVEDKGSLCDYPVGIGVHGEKIHFLHYPNFATAIDMWNKRKLRIDKSNMAVMLTNLGCGIEGLRDGASPADVYQEEATVIERFNKLPFKNKLIFSDKKFDMPNVVYIKNYKGFPQWGLFRLNKRSFLKRYIDQFDYVNYLNKINNN